VPRTRTTKKLAQRIDLNYFQRRAPLRQWKFWLSVALPALAVLWLGWHAVAGDARVYSGGRMSPAHAILTARCETCHVRTAGAFSVHAGDAACLTCHDGPVHHANAVFTPSCASCHVEHRGTLRLAATADANCTQCHADLHTTGATTRLVRDITGFEKGHPEFAVLRADRGDPTTIKLNHYRHLQPNLAGPNGPVQLACGDCHRAPADTRIWPYGEAPFRAATPLSSDPLGARPNAAYMAAPSYAKACAACHTLEFDKRFAEGAPHDTPEVIHDFLTQKFRSYIADHPAELREARQPDRDLPERPVAPDFRTVSAETWVGERTAEAEQLLWGKTCKQCHTLEISQGAALPRIVPSNITVRFMPHARFDHAAHQLVDCTGCHARATSSQESTELLLPGIATCQKCHRPDAQAAESQCFECHTYHDQSQWHPAPGRFKLPELLGALAHQAKISGGVVLAEK
jgi:hypothetical protein